MDRRIQKSHAVGPDRRRMTSPCRPRTVREETKAFALLGMGRQRWEVRDLA